jgi:hypothetical protein
MFTAGGLGEDESIGESFGIRESEGKTGKALIYRIKGNRLSTVVSRKTDSIGSFIFFIK